MHYWGSAEAELVHKSDVVRFVVARGCMDSPDS